MPHEPSHRGILAIDIEGFARKPWTDPIRVRLRGRLHGLVDDALAQAQVSPYLTVRNDIGDGLLLLVHAEVSTARLLHPLITALVSGLVEDNQHASAAERMRLRVVVHAGEILADAHGHTGDDLNHAFRLLNAEVTRAVLASSPVATLVLVVSEVVYQGVVRHAHAGIDPDGWQPVHIHEKETVARAWVHLPGLADQPDLPAVLVAPVVGLASPPIPRELPRPTADFTGRSGELDALCSLLAPDARGATGPGQRMVIGAIDGMGGVGKSALAIQAAHRLADAFPDGQLYVNLQGATPGLEPLAPLDVLSRLLRSLSLEPAAIPADVQEAAARFRSLAAERRLLVVLDDAHSPEQVRPLLPGSPTCGVLITSRQNLAILGGTQALHLDLLPPEHALELLGRVAGQHRIAAEPEAAGEVVRKCGRLSLAIRIAGARLAARPTWPVQALADRLADATHRLKELTAGQLAVRACFDVSLHTLQESPDPIDRAAAAAFELLGLSDGPEIGLTGAAKLLDQPNPSTQILLERLVDAQLLETPRPGRYRFHDLVRLYARQHATGPHLQCDQLAALTRLIGFYTTTAEHTLPLLDPWRKVATTDPRWADGGLEFQDAPAALAWLEAERANLLVAIPQAATTPGMPAGLAGQLTRALFGFFLVRNYWQDGVQANLTALEFARRTQDRAAQTHAHIDLGTLFRLLGRYEEAIACLQSSLAICREIHDRLGLAASLSHLGAVYRLLGRYEEAITSLQASLVLCQEIHDQPIQALNLSNLGIVYRLLGRYEEAITCLQASLDLRRELHDHRGEAASLGKLGLVYGLLGRCEEAITCLQASLVIDRKLGNRWGQAHCLIDLGVVYGLLGRYEEAITSLQASLKLCGELSDQHGQAEALRDLGDALHAVDRDDQARLAWQDALAICEALQIPETDEIRARLEVTSPP